MNLLERIGCLLILNGVLFSGTTLGATAVFLPAAHERNAALELPDQMRGINTKLSALTADLFALLKETDVNVIRINFDRDVRTGGVTPTPQDPLAPYEKSLRVLDEALPTLKEMKINLIVSAGNIYGRDLDVMWKNTDRADAVHQHLAEFWHAFSIRYKNSDVIVAYDILNEPNYPTGQDAVWYEKMLPNSIEAIRSINTNIWLVIEPGPWGLPSGFERMPLIDDPYVIYSFHHYAPHSYTHQGILAYADYEAVYPGTNKMFKSSPSSHWGKEELRESMQPAIDFAQIHKVRMFVGEFSPIRWADGGAVWLEDSIDLFEEQGWDWCFHSIGGWNGWNPTYGVDAALDSKMSDGGDRTDRWQVLAEKWSLNRDEPKTEAGSSRSK